MPSPSTSFRTGRGALGAALLALAAAIPGTASPAPRATPRVVLVDRLPKSLAGTWEFALGDPVNGIKGIDALAWRPMVVPGSWQDAGVPKHGTAWYRVRFGIAPSVADTPLALACEQIRDADEVFLDGRLVGKTGGFPPRYEKATLVARVYELPATLTADPMASHVLAIRVHNPGPRAGGITGTPFLDSVSSALKQRTLREAPRALLAAAIAGLGLFALSFFVRDRHQTDFLWFFLVTFAFLVSIGTWLSVWDGMGVSLTLLFRLNFAASFALFAIFLVFFLHFFEKPMALRHRLVVVCLSALVAMALLWPRADDIYYVTPVFYLLIAAGGIDILIMLARDARRDVPYAKPVLASSIVIFLAVLFDIGQDVGLFGDPVGSFRLVGPTFLLFTIVFLSVVADRFARMRVAATTDPLTGLANRSVLFDRIALEVARARRHAHSVSLAVLDLDHFKRFNDAFGHPAGDRLMIAVAEALTRSVRDTDLAARYGGEEFVVLLPDAGKEDALVCLERIRQAVAEARVPGVARGVTISIGVAVFDPTEGGSVTVGALLRQADAALYDAKAAGRDRIVVSEGMPSGPSSSGSFAMDAVRRKAEAQKKGRAEAG